MTKITRFRWNKFQDEEVYMTYNDVRDIIEPPRSLRWLGNMDIPAGLMKFSSTHKATGNS